MVFVIQVKISEDQNKNMLAKKLIQQAGGRISTTMKGAKVAIKRVGQAGEDGGQSWLPSGSKLSSCLEITFEDLKTFIQQDV